MSIILVRHGQTNYNFTRKLQGVSNGKENELNEKGIEQAKITRDKLKNEDFDLIICSPLTRAKQTADIINKDRNVQILYDDRIIERDFGEFEGENINEIDTAKIWSYYANEKYEKAENINSFLTRINSFINEVQEQHPDKNVLVVAHAGVSMGFYCYFNGIPKEDNLLDIRLKNCEYIKYE